MSRYEEFDRYEQLIKERLSKKRFNHSMNVAEACYSLAERFGADKKRCYLAGLLHDIMKEEAQEIQLKYARESGYTDDEAELSSPPLLHSIAGAKYVRDELGITDEEILRAIRFHTAGGAALSDLEKIVYLGDMISEERDYKDVDKFREFCYDDMDVAMSVALIYNIRSVCKKFGFIPQTTLEAYNYYLKFNKKKESL